MAGFASLWTFVSLGGRAAVDVLDADLDAGGTEHGNGIEIDDDADVIELDDEAMHALDAANDVLGGTVNGSISRTDFDEVLDDVPETIDVDESAYDADDDDDDDEDDGDMLQSADDGSFSMQPASIWTAAAVRIRTTRFQATPASSPPDLRLFDI